MMQIPSAVVTCVHDLHLLALGYPHRRVRPRGAVRQPRTTRRHFPPHGLRARSFPRLSGILSAGHALKTHLDANGLDPDELERDEIDELLENTPAGQQIIDIGRMLSDVEVQAPDGRRLEFASIAFSDCSSCSDYPVSCRVSAPTI
jgi:hypothetical protein